MRKVFGFSGFVGALTTVLASSALSWEIDFSRRRKDFNVPTSENSLVKEAAGSEGSFLGDIFEGQQPVTEVVILNTEHGFVPPSVRVKKGNSYKFHVVNVNEKNKNVSFILDAFSEFHGTFFGKIRTFDLKPKQEGVYSFQCPETSLEGRLIVIGNVPARTTAGTEVSSDGNN